MHNFCTIEEALNDIKKGKPVVVVDDTSENTEGNLVIAAELVNSDVINLMSGVSGGIIAVAGTSERIENLELEVLPLKHHAGQKVKFAATIDAANGIEKGVSSADRAYTIRLFADPESKSTDFLSPGHVVTLKAMDGGVLSRAGHTEAAVDLTRIAGLKPAGVLGMILTPDGNIAGFQYISEFAKKNSLTLISIKDLIEYRRKREKLVRAVVSVNFPTHYGTFTLKMYESDIDEHHHLAIVKGDVSGDEPVLVRVHSECLTGDVLGSLRCDCGEQLTYALKAVEKEGRGVVLYMRQEGRGIGLMNKIKAYKLQDDGLDTVEANIKLGFPPDLRDYGIGAQILTDLGIKKIRLMTNNPKKIIGLEGYGLEIVERVPVEVPTHIANAFYMQTKKDKMGHILDLKDIEN